MSSTHHIHYQQHPPQSQQHPQTPQPQHVGSTTDNNNLDAQQQRNRLQLLPTGEEYNCNKCGSLGCDLRIIPCGCVLHARCVPLGIFSDYKMNGMNNNSQNQASLTSSKTARCPVCNSTSSPMSGIYLFPLSFRDLEEASSLRRRCVASAAAVSAATSQQNSERSGRGKREVAAVVATTNSLVMEDDIHQITAAAAPYLAVSHGLCSSSHSRGAAAVGGANCNDSSSSVSSTSCHRRTSHHEIDRHRRTGRWTTEEMAYIDHLISAFDQGMLPLPNGIKLNEFLSDLLLCKSSRLTKKMKNAKLSTRLFDISLPDAGGDTAEENKNLFCSGTLSRLQKLFLKSVSSEPTKLELQFNMQRMWRTHFSNLCLQIGYETLHAQDWLASLDELEQKISTVEEMIRRARRKRMGMALQRKDNGSTSHMHQQQQQQQPANQVTLMSTPKSTTSAAACEYNKSIAPSTTSTASITPSREPPSFNAAPANDFRVDLNDDNKTSYAPPQLTVENALLISPRLTPSSPKFLPKTLSSASLASLAGQRSRLYSDDLSLSVLESLMEENGFISNTNNGNAQGVTTTLTTSASSASALPPPSSRSSTMENHYTQGTPGTETALKELDITSLSSPSSLGDRGPFIDMVLRYMELNNVPFEYVDVWVPSFMPQNDEGPSDDKRESDDNLRLCHAGYGTRKDLLSPNTAFNLNEFGTYSKQFSFRTGVGLPGRTYSSGIPTWEESIQHSDPKHFKRCGGAKVYGVKTVLGIPVPSPSIGRIVVAMYSTKDVLKNVELVKRCYVEFSKYLPEPRWKLVIDIGISFPSNPTLESEVGGNVTVTASTHHQTVSNVVSAGSSSSLSYGNTDYGNTAASPNKRDYNQMQQQQINASAEITTLSSNQQVQEHTLTSGYTNTSFDTTNQSSKRFKEESTTIKIPNTDTDDEDLERQIASLLGEQMPLDSLNDCGDSLDVSNHSNQNCGDSPALSAISHNSQHGSNLMSGFVSLRLLLLRPPARRSSKDADLLDILKASYKGYANGNRRSGKELAKLLVRDWMFLTSGNASSPLSYNDNTAARHVHYGNSSSGTSSSFPSSSDQQNIVFSGSGDNTRNFPSPIMSNNMHHPNNNLAITKVTQQQNCHKIQKQQTVDASGLLRRNLISFTSTSSEENRNSSISGVVMGTSSPGPATSSGSTSSFAPSSSTVSVGGGAQHRSSHDGGTSGNGGSSQKPAIISEA